MKAATRGGRSKASGGSVKSIMCHRLTALTVYVNAAYAADMADDVALDCDRLNAWIGDRLPGEGAALSAARLGEGTGIANALFLVTRGDREWILRRPPAVKNDPTASNTAREWRILDALNGTAVP